MPSMTRLDTEKLRFRRIVATAAITVVAIAFLLLSETFGLVGATPPAAEPSDQAADEQVPRDRREADQTGADQARGEPAAAYRLDRAAGQISLSEPGAPPDSERSSPSVSEQRIFKSRRALETIDPRDFVRQAAMPK
jgi:hypothetical protein